MKVNHWICGIIGRPLSRLVRLGDGLNSMSTGLCGQLVLLLLLMMVLPLVLLVLLLLETRHIGVYHGIFGIKIHSSLGIVGFRAGLDCTMTLFGAKGLNSTLILCVCVYVCVYVCVCVCVRKSVPLCVREHACV